MSGYDSAFRRACFPCATRREWNDWRWQLRRRFTSVDALSGIWKIAPAELAAAKKAALPFSLTPYYAALIPPGDSRHPLRRSIWPHRDEGRCAKGEFIDPLGEEAHSPVPGLVRSYPDKVLFLVTDQCPVYCRFCTRSRAAGSGRFAPSEARWARALAYIRRHREIRDVLISGGEPLLLGDDKLKGLLDRLRRIRHVELIRIGTKAPAVLPQRITPGLVRALRRYHPLWLSVHFTHPDELTPECAAACARLADAGIPMCSQTVLLRGVNDKPETIKRLMLGLLKIRVKPYYLHQCDAVAGASRFRTSIETGQRIIRALHGHTTGYAVPAYMLDAPGGGGKVPLTPDYIVGYQNGHLRVRNYRGKTYWY